MTIRKIGIYKVVSLRRAKTDALHGNVRRTGFVFL